MVSKILLKLIDQAIVPAIVLLSVRLISVVLVARYFEIPVNINASGFTFTNANDYILINSYSSFLMVAVLTVGIFYILAKSLVFHETHIKPEMTAKLFSLNLHSLIQPSINLYAQASIWLSYSYLIMLTSGVMVYFRLIFPWVFYVTLVLCVISTVLLVLDVEREIKMGKLNDLVFDEDDEYVEEGSLKQ